MTIDSVSDLQNYELTGRVLMKSGHLVLSEIFLGHCPVFSQMVIVDSVSAEYSTLKRSKFSSFVFACRKFEAISEITSYYNWICYLRKPFRRSWKGIFLESSDVHMSNHAILLFSLVYGDTSSTSSHGNKIFQTIFYFYYNADNNTIQKQNKKTLCGTEPRESGSGSTRRFRPLPKTNSKQQWGRPENNHVTVCYLFFAELLNKWTHYHTVFAYAKS